MTPETQPLIYIQTPAPKSRLEQLINNPPISVLVADREAIRWLDNIKRELANLK